MKQYIVHQSNILEAVLQKRIQWSTYIIIVLEASEGNHVRGRLITTIIKYLESNNSKCKFLTLYESLFFKILTDKKLIAEYGIH